MGFEPNFHKKVDWTHGFDLQIKGRETMLLSEDFTWEEQFSAFDIKGATSPTTDASTDDSITYDDDNLLQNTADEPLEGNNWGDEFGSFNDLGAVVNTPNLGEYIFEPSNPFLSHPNPALEGVRLLEDGYSLTDVALAFEAAVQKDPEDSQAWTNLGNTQAQNEKNIPAIRALEKAVAITPGNLDALMFLSVCYTNESYDHAAYMTLERWITLKYPSVLKHHPLSDKASSFELQTRTTDLFLTIARQTPDAENMDPDVQVGLGVLFYGCGDLDKAVDCFISALKSRPDVSSEMDHLFL
jgi:peroxin-5